ncbi:SAM-dependent methyltransferase [Alteromonas lipolytica]|uniref:Tetrapyrrole methylase domain-containing protein n=1 Tax=Alteromonas lipolytica TaxID=1856405 RepID=A0A1E8FGG0_9ALTE|nr:SAM-dependent methyltransferase [Alteromonas lipolytica]OFI35020.1 hypothetical protein BFC17_15805 [Alteromonas lipolytica]GGF55948.1 hypothetical protein GCM10011338_05300 [Alteromonas lipolytica]
MTIKTGSLVCVGPGMILGAHITERCRNFIAQADVVFMSCHTLVEQWIATMNKDVRSLQPYYGANKDRRETYREMQQAMMSEVRLGKKVVGVFYGHPGIFAQVPHYAIEQAREEGYTAYMEPGISADACLYADMGIDPGRYGIQQYEASQFLFYQRNIDPSAYLILWQIGHVGDVSLTTRQSGPAERQVLVEELGRYYPENHQIAIYECPFIITEKPKIIWFALKDLPQAEISLVSTLVIPPGRAMTPSSDIVARLRLIYETTKTYTGNEAT